MKATRIRSGLYKMERFTIERVEYFEQGTAAWNILGDDGSWQETLTTLRDCKDWVKSHLALN